MLELIKNVSKPYVSAKKGPFLHHSTFHTPFFCITSPLWANTPLHISDVTCSHFLFNIQEYLDNETTHSKSDVLSQVIIAQNNQIIMNWKYFSSTSHSITMTCCQNIWIPCILMSSYKCLLTTDLTQLVARSKSTRLVARGEGVK